jgi:hypothetical protein
VLEATARSAAPVPGQRTALGCGVTFYGADRALAGNRRQEMAMDDYSWVYDDRAVDWDALSELYRIAPLGEKSPADLATVFSNSRF